VSWATAASQEYALNAQYTTATYLNTSLNGMEVNGSHRKMWMMLDWSLVNVAEYY
jgi:hypothetical protein